MHGATGNINANGLGENVSEPKRSGSNVDKWSSWYSGLTEPAPYGDVTSYHAADRFLHDCVTVEDWGTGRGWFKTLRPDSVGVDGSWSKFCDVHVDLTDYTTSVDGILLRHVLEHNYEWQAILRNAIVSAQHKLYVILFTPVVDETHAIAFAEDPGVPDISFNIDDITGPMFAAGFSVSCEEVESRTQYGVETLIGGRR